MFLFQFYPKRDVQQYNSAVNLAIVNLTLKWYTMSPAASMALVPKLNLPWIQKKRVILISCLDRVKSIISMTTRQTRLILWYLSNITLLNVATRLLYNAQWLRVVRLVSWKAIWSYLQVIIFSTGINRTC